MIIVMNTMHVTYDHRSIHVWYDQNLCQVQPPFQFEDANSSLLSPHGSATSLLGSSVWRQFSLEGCVELWNVSAVLSLSRDTPKSVIGFNKTKLSMSCEQEHGPEEGCKKSEKTQISVLLHLMGEEAIELYGTFEFGVDEGDLKLEDVIDKFDAVFLPKKNDLYEHFKFFQAKQKQGQSVDNYLKDLKVLVSSCNFQDRDVLLRDKFIFGLLNTSLVEKFLRDPNITLDKAVMSARAAEIAHKELINISLGNNSNQIDTGSDRLDIDNIQSSRRPGRREFSCSKCGLVHARDKCPAAEEICFRCKNKGHFARNCYRHNKNNPVSGNGTNKYKVHECEVEEENYCLDNLKSVALYAVESSGNSKAWFCNIRIEGKEVKFKLDSGSEVNILPMYMYKKLCLNKNLKPADVKLVPYGDQTNIFPQGKVDLFCAHENIQKKVEFLIVDLNVIPLLGLETCVDLQLIKKTYSIQRTCTKDEILEENKDVFTGLGKIPGKYHITLKEDAVPVISPPRRVPFKIQNKLRETLDKMVADGIIDKVDEPTDWVSNLVIKEKKTGELRLCIDPKALNENIKREHYALPTCDEIIQRLNGRAVFSVIDMKQGFWQIELDEESAKLCTFGTMFGRYCFKKAPFGLASIPEVFGKKVSQIFSDIEGVEVYFDDIIVAGYDDEEHDELLRKVLEKARQFNVKFNPDKFQYKQEQVKFLGKEISKQGVRPDKEQVAAIINMESPKNRKELMRFLGMTKYLAQFIPKLSELTAPLRELTKDRMEWTWSNHHEDCYVRLKNVMATRPVLRFFDASKQLVIETDASKDGLGSCLLIENQPVSFASRALTSSEKMYAQIEKELLAIVFAVEKFHQFVYGHKVIVFTDHKPLTTILKKNINDVAARLQKLLLRLFKYDIDVRYKPGSQMFISDALSRAFQKNCSSDLKLEDYMVHDVMVFNLNSQLCISDEKKRHLIHETMQDKELQMLKSVLLNGWPTCKNDLPLEIRIYWQHRNELIIEDELIFYNNRVVIPMSLRSKYLLEIHEGHLGIVKCKARARESLFWPALNSDIQDMIEKCRTCVQFSRNNQKEPLIPLPKPNRAWERVSTDIFTFDDTDYLVLVDAYSLWIELFTIHKKSTAEIITKLKNAFARYGVPEVLYSDNVPFNSDAMRVFAEEWNFNQVFSSPLHSQSNGLAEKAVAICKNLLRKTKESHSDVNIALLNYRNTTIAGMSLSPSELFMNRKLKTKLPVNSEILQPKMNENVEDKWERKVNNQKEQYDQHAKPLPELSVGENVFMKLNDVWVPGKIVAIHENPRSYIVHSNGRNYRRNRLFIKPFRGSFNEPEIGVLSDDEEDPVGDPEVQVRTEFPSPQARAQSPQARRSSRIRRPPIRLESSPIAQYLPRDLRHRTFHSELLVESVWCSLNIDNIGGAQFLKKCHSWGTALYIGVILIKTKIPRVPNTPKLNAMFDTVRLEWSADLCIFLLEVLNCAKQYRESSNKFNKLKPPSPILKVESKPSYLGSLVSSVHLTNVNLFYISDQMVCVMCRVDSLSLESGLTKTLMHVEGIKIASITPSKHQFVCVRCEEVKDAVGYVKLVRLEYKYAGSVSLDLLDHLTLTWSMNLHLKLLTMHQEITTLVRSLIGSNERPPNSTPAGVACCLCVNVKASTQIRVIVSPQHSVLFETDNITYTRSAQNETTWSLPMFYIKIDDITIFTLDSVHVSAMQSSQSIAQEREHIPDFVQRTNRAWCWTIKSFKAIFPYEHDFATAVQNEFISVVKWLRLLHKKPQTGVRPLPCDFILKVKEFLFEASDDPFEVKLRDNYELLEDEYKESLKRQKMLDTKLEELYKSHLLIPSAKLEELYANLNAMNSKIYIHRCRQMNAQVTPRTRLFAAVMNDVEILAMSDPAIHGAENIVKIMTDIDQDSPWPEDGVEFSTLWCRAVTFSCREWKFLLRDFPLPWLDIGQLHLWGRLVGAEQEATRRAKRGVKLQIGEPYGDITVERSMTSLKFYHDFNCEVEHFTYAFGPCWEPVIAQCNLSLEKIFPPSRDPSPPLPLWDKIRLLYHGRLTMMIRQLTLLLHVSLDPYNTTEEMEVTWSNVAMDWTTGKFVYKGDLDVYVRTASKYDDCRLLHFPNLKLSIKLKWLCLGEPHDHHSVMPCAPDKLPEYSSNQEHDSYRAFRSHNVNVSLGLETKPVTNPVSPSDPDCPVILLYGSTLRWFENLKFILSGVTRPTRRGAAFKNFRPRKIPLSRHYRKIHLLLALHKFQAHYWMSFAMQRGIELISQRITSSSEHTLSLVPVLEDGLKHRPRPNWSASYMNCELNDAEVWLKSAIQEEKEVLSLRQPVEKCYCLSVGKVSYGRETIIVGAPPSIPSGSDSTEYPPTHRLVVHHLKGAWTTSNRDVVFALFESFMKNQQLKKNLSTAALKSFRASDASSTPLKSRSRSVEGQITPPSSSSLQSQVQVQNTPSPMSKLQSGQAASMLQQLIAEVENKAVVFSDDLSAQTREQHLQGLAACNEDDVVHKNWLIALVNSQVLLKGCETKGYVIVSAAKAEILQRVHRPVWKDRILVSKTTWIGSLE
ncbi:hypothetical protein M8J77_003057 [Diaphorina citri]|nr:hypothetical protein M8J77_003057 [Diaphorina citri]